MGYNNDLESNSHGKKEQDMQIFVEQTAPRSATKRKAKGISKRKQLLYCVVIAFMIYLGMFLVHNICDW
jgi:cell division protein FtsL